MEQNVVIMLPKVTDYVQYSFRLCTRDRISIGTILLYYFVNAAVSHDSTKKLFYFADVDWTLAVVA